MASAFIHKYELIVGNPTELLTSTQNTETATPAPTALPEARAADVVEGVGSSSGYSDYSTETTDALKISDLQIEASIKYNTAPSGKSVQPAEIKIYNLTETAINFISGQSSVILKAGYRDDEAIPVLYIGQVISVSTERLGEDIVTTLLCGDGVNVIKNSKYEKTYNKGGTYGAILSDLITQFSEKGIPKGDFIEGERTTKVTPRAVIASGLLAEALAEVCGAIDYVWYISLGKLYIQPKEIDGLKETVKIIEANVKGTIGVLDDKSSTTSFSKSDKPKGIKLTTFLNGNISTNTTLNVSFGKHAGDYKITSVAHTLNFRGDAWETVVECQRLNT